jgi:serine/threonine protein kinase
MPNSRTERAEEIFYEALEITDPGERLSFLDRACDADADLRAQVERMLSSQAGAEDFFTRSQPALEPPLDIARTLGRQVGIDGGLESEPPLEERPGTVIGPYTVLQKLGEGGCGVVYMAEQEQPMRRRVALKIIKLGMDTRSVIARFRAEQQALALMDHPNIAQVLDAGATATGRPYFIMELVRGIRLTTFCDQHQMEMRQRLRLFIQLCYAVQHAHQKGIIHRDIKPSNILVTLHDGAPVPKVIDFGIAKAIEGRLTDQTLQTTRDQFIGTPAYMSPEQADMTGLDVDTRSDIYSLGVLLHELLTGKTPFETKELLRSGVDAMRRILREREPQRASVAVSQLPREQLVQAALARRVEPGRLISQLRGDLDWIVMKALEKDRTRRYQTANGLALDVQRYLENEPILARPPGQLYRLQKLIRRNKIVFAATGVTAIALIVSSGVSTWLLLKERAARARALEAERQKGSLQREAERLESLRKSAEDGRRLQEAAAVFYQGQREKADALLDEIGPHKPASAHASMYRDLGDWHALSGRWAKARERFDALIQINEFGASESTMDDIRSAIVLVEHGQLEDYERFRESLVTRYAGTDNPTIAQRVLRECLLIPAKEELMNALASFAEVSERSLTGANVARDRAAIGWQSYALALMAYRRGDYGAALNWCRRADPSNSGFVTRDLSVRLIDVMARARLGEIEKARIDLESCRADMQKVFAPKAAKTSGWLGFWFDRVCVEIHLREASLTVASTE